MKKKLLSAGLFGLLATGVFAQQDIQFTQFMNNRLFYNPGVAGSNGSICLNGGYRTQWVGFENAPTTSFVNAEVPVALLKGGFQLNISNDQIGYFQDITMGLGYAYQTSLFEGSLGIGFRVDFRNMSLNQGSWLPPESLNDPSLGKFGSSDMSPDLNLGVYYQRSDFWAGISSNRLIQAKTELENNANPPGVTSVTGKRHYFVMGGYNWEIPNTAFLLTPGVMIKTDLAGPIQADINISGWYNNKIWGGVSYRLQDAVSMMVGYQVLPEMRVSYSYDVTTSALRTASDGSHEIMLSYCFKIEIPPREKGYYRNPRFL
jgi:type IX secretion system PorP/SprF family membrane protein